MAEFRMPALGADMSAGTLLRWLVKPGDRVSRGDIVAEVETDKADVEVEIFESGTIEALVVGEGEKVPVGTVLATLTATEGAPRPAAVSPPAAPRRPIAAAPPVHVPSPPVVTPAHRATPTARRLAEERGVSLADLRGTGVGGAITRSDVDAASRRPAGGMRVRATPRARRLAAELGVDLATVHGTGDTGAVTAEDIQRARDGGLPPAGVSAPAPQPRRSDEERAVAFRRAIGQAMERSKREIPHYYLGTSIDMSRALAWLEEANASKPITGRILPAVLLLKAVALATKAVPEVNGHWDGELRIAERVHLGVAISLRGGGLVAPAVHDADTLSLDDLMKSLRDLVARSRAGKLRSSEMSDPTITVTNLGEQGVETVFPIIFAPQVAIVGFGKISERPWAVDGLLGVRPIVQASLSADHRASVGHRGGQFLAAVDQYLQEPEKL